MWKFMRDNIENLEQVIWWDPRSAPSSVFFESWSNVRSLLQHQKDVHFCHGIKDIDIFQLSRMRLSKMKNISEYVVLNVINNMNMIKQLSYGDKSWWITNNTG